MAILRVGPSSAYQSIAAAMLYATPADTIVLESNYSNENADIRHNGMTVTGGAGSVGITLRLAPGVTSISLTGLAPINIIDSASGNAIVGNNGNNQITVTGGADAVNGGLGNDRLIVDYALAIGNITGDSTSNFTEAGGGGRLVTVTDGTIEHFTILTGRGADTITTGNGNDIIRTGNGASTVSAGQGANIITGGNDADTVTALDGGNRIDAGNGANTVTTGGGNDTIATGYGADTIVSGSGADLITVRGGADQVNSGANFDRLIVDYSAVTSNVTGGVTNGSLAAGYTGNIASISGNSINFVGVEGFYVTLGSGNDNIRTGSASDFLAGGAGYDTLDGGAGVDILQGDAGNDTYIVRNAGSKIIETAGNGTADRVAAVVSFALAADDHIESMSTTFYAGTTAINLTGNALAQRIIGNAGANRLDGKGGNDTLSAGAGPDVFVFTSTLGVGNVDRITDYSVAADTVSVENAVFLGLATGVLAATAFVRNTTGAAADASDRIIYETDTGALLFDRDGTGAIAAVRFATLGTNLAVTNADFLVF